MAITTNLSPIQVCACMKAAGFPPSEWATGAAVAMAESSDVADNVNTASGAYGLFQVQKSSHPELFAQLQYPDEWKDPIINTAMAKKVWDGRGSKWDTGGWQSLGNAQFRAALPAATAAAAQLQQNLEQAGSTDAQTKLLQNLLMPVSPVLQGYTTAGTEVLNTLASGAAAAGQFTVASGAAVNQAVTSTPLDWLSTIGQFFSRLGQANTWLRIGEFLLGAALVVVGTAHLMSGTPVGRAAAGVVKKAAIL
jgi:hypothetical protein